MKTYAIVYAGQLRSVYRAALWLQTDAFSEVRSEICTRHTPDKEVARLAQNNIHLPPPLLLCTVDYSEGSCEVDAIS